MDRCGQLLAADVGRAPLDPATASEGCCRLLPLTSAVLLQLAVLSMDPLHWSATLTLLLPTPVAAPAHPCRSPIAVNLLVELFKTLFALGTLIAYVGAVFILGYRSRLRLDGAGPTSAVFLQRKCRAGCFLAAAAHRPAPP